MIDDMMVMKHAPMPLSRMAPKGRKLYETLHYVCRFCKKGGHDMSYCPSKPMEHMNDYMKQLLSMSRVHMNVYTKMKDDGLIVIRDYVMKHGAKINEGNPWKNMNGRYYELRKQIGYWKAIGANHGVLSWIGNTVPWRFSSEPAWYHFPNSQLCDEHKEFIDKEIHQHVAEGTWIVVDCRHARVINPLTVTVNNMGKARLCLDLRWPNAHQPIIDFRLDSLRTHGHQLIAKDDRMIFMDLEKAYYSVPVDEAAWPYLCWQWKGITMTSKVMPFGAALAPYIFHKIMRVVVAFMHACGIKILNYLDDFMVCAHVDHINACGMFISWLMPLLGWRVSVKSQLTPSIQGVFLGVDINSNVYQYSVPLIKIKRAYELVESCQKSVDAHDMIACGDKLASLAGILISFMLGFNGVRPWTRSIHHAAAQLRGKNILSDDDMQHLVEELYYWKDVLMKPERNGRPISTVVVDIHVSSDASENGYGATIDGPGGMKVHGALAMDDMKKSSTS